MTDEKITIAKLDKMQMIEKVHKVEREKDKPTEKEPNSAK